MAKPKKIKTRAKRTNPRGRPTLFKPEITKQLLGLISVGTPLEMACQGAGVAYRTFRDWMTGGEMGDVRYADFYVNVHKAQGQAVGARLLRIQRAAEKGTWQADAWWLERRYPRDFGIRREISGPDGGPIQIADTGRDKLAKILQDMAEKHIDVKPNGHDKPNGFDKSNGHA